MLLGVRLCGAATSTPDRTTSLFKWPADPQHLVDTHILRTAQTHSLLAKHGMCEETEPPWQACSLLKLNRTSTYPEYQKAEKEEHGHVLPKESF